MDKESYQKKVIKEMLDEAKAKSLSSLMRGDPKYGFSLHAVMTEGRGQLIETIVLFMKGVQHQRSELVNVTAGLKLMGYGKRIIKYQDFEEYLQLIMDALGDRSVEDLVELADYQGTLLYKKSINELSC